MLINEVLTEDELQELSWQDVGDTAHALSSGLTFGTRDNIAAAIKSAFGSKKYQEYLKAEKEKTQEIKNRSATVGDTGLTAYDMAELLGSIAVPIPWVGMIGGGAKAVAKIMSKSAHSPAAKFAKSVNSPPITKTGERARFAANSAIDVAALTGVDAATKSHNMNTFVDLAKSKGGDENIAKAQYLLKLPVTGKMDQATEFNIRTIRLNFAPFDSDPIVDQQTLKYIQDNYR